MDRVVPLHSDSHREAEMLLPWYVSGTLDAGDHARVEAHLADCARCREELAVERRLGAEVAGLAVERELGWERLRDRAAAESAPGTIARLADRLPRTRTLALFVGAQAAAIAAAVLLIPPRLAQPAYTTLSSPAPARTGNVIVIFRPDVREAELRALLDSHHAQLVEGPTPAGAWLLSVPAADRAATLAALGKRREVVLAQPVDAPAPQ